MSSAFAKRMSISCCDGPTSWWWYSTGIPIVSSARIVSRRTLVAASIVVCAKYPPSSSVCVPYSSLKRKYSASGPTLNVSNPIDCIRSSARRRAWRGSPSYGSPSGVTTSQIIRAPRPSGRTRNVSGSGIATMSDSSIALKPVIDEPSNPMPSSSAPSTSPTVIEKLFKCPSRSVNQRSMSSTPRFLISSSTRLRASGSDVARFLLSTCAIAPPRRSTWEESMPEELPPGGLLHESAVLQRLPPAALSRVPVHRLAHSVGEVDVRFPAELAPQLGGVEQVAPVVPRAVRDDRLQRLRLPRQLEHRVGDLLDRLLDAAADVVRLADAPAVEDELDRAAVVADVQPLAFVPGRCVQRQLDVVERVRDEERDHLLRELKRPVVVGAVRDRHWHAVRLVVRANCVVGAGLRCVVRRARPVRRLLGEDLVAVERKIAVDLARRHVVEALHTDAARRLEERLRAEDVRPEEADRFDDGEAVVRLGGEVHDDVDRLGLEQALAELEVRNVAFDERRLRVDVGER